MLLLQADGAPAELSEGAFLVVKSRCLPVAGLHSHCVGLNEPWFLQPIGTGW